MTFNDFQGYRKTMKPVLELKKWRKNKLKESPKHIFSASMLGLCMVIALIVILLGMFEGCSMAYTLDQWANAIHKAEGNDNYGILTKYKHTTYRQACKNTVLHNYKRWLKSGESISFLRFLGNRYCPLGSNNDPTGLNRYWIKNVGYYLERN